MQLLVEAHQHGHGVLARRNRRPEVLQPLFQPRRARRGLKEWNQFLGKCGRIGERKRLRVRLDEEIERVDDGHVGDEVDDEFEVPRALREHQARDPVPVGILLPVQEMLRGFDFERIADDGRPAVRRRTQTHFMRRKRDEAVEFVPGAMLERDADRHARV